MILSFIKGNAWEEVSNDFKLNINANPMEMQSTLVFIIKLVCLVFIQHLVFISTVAMYLQQ